MQSRHYKIAQKMLFDPCQLTSPDLLFHFIDIFEVVTYCLGWNRSAFSSGMLPRSATWGIDHAPCPLPLATVQFQERRLGLQLLFINSPGKQDCERDDDDVGGAGVDSASFPPRGTRVAGLLAVACSDKSGEENSARSISDRSSGVN